MVYRKIIACKHAHGFMGNYNPSPNPLQGREVLMVCDYTVEGASDRLDALAEQYGWKRGDDGAWECGSHFTAEMTAQATQGTDRAYQQLVGSAAGQFAKTPPG